MIRNRRCPCEPDARDKAQAFEKIDDASMRRGSNQRARRRIVDMVVHQCYSGAKTSDASDFTKSLNQLANRRPPAPFNIRNNPRRLQRRMVTSRRTANQLNSYIQAGRSLQIQFNLVRVIKKPPLTVSLVDRSRIASHSPKPANTQTKRFLHVWMVDSTDYLGLASFPWESASPWHGINIHYKTIHPKFKYRPFHQNKTIVHEIGHWLGLLHTFTYPTSRGPHPVSVNDERGIQREEQYGDLIPDTARQVEPTYGNPLQTKRYPTLSGNLSCFISYMDYSDDAAMYEFTLHQVRRAHNMFDRYRR